MANYWGYALGAAPGLLVQGFSQQMDASKAMAATQRDQIAQEQQMEQLRQQQMNMEAQRRQSEMVRTQQRARAIALSTGVGQTGSGAVNGSSVLPGAFGGISGQTNVNQMGIQQNQSFGNQMFGLQANVSADKIKQSFNQQSYQEGGALTSMGGMLLSSMGTLAKIGGG